MQTQECLSFQFPHLPSYYTIIAEPSDQQDSDETKYSRDVLVKVREAISQNRDNNTTLDELLMNCSVDKDNHIQALKESEKGTVILLKRQPNECFVNNYNSAVMLAWQVNMDLQFVLNAYTCTCVMYIASYITKSNRAMGLLLRTVAIEARTEELNQQLRKVGSVFLTHRELSVQECVYRVLSMPLKQLSHVNVYINTNSKSERVTVLKTKEVLDNMHKDNTDVFQKSFIDRYCHRPRIVQSMCLAEFAAAYNVDYCDKDPPNDVLPEPDSNK